MDLNTPASKSAAGIAPAAEEAVQQSGLNTEQKDAVRRYRMLHDADCHCLQVDRKTTVYIQQCSEACQVHLRPATYWEGRAADPSPALEEKHHRWCT